MVGEQARAKVNLGLAVLGRRPDGYHELHTLFATVDLADRVRLAARPEGIVLSVRGAVLPEGPQNLAYRAAQAYLEAAGLRRGVAIEIEKTIPVAAGLGGGSANAAAVLRGMTQLYPADLDLFALARDLGADVPFLLRGGLAEARGVGEQLRFLPPRRFFLVLVNPGFPVSTERVYRSLRPEEFGPPLEADAILEALESGRMPPWRNDLEAAAFRLYPELARWKTELSTLGTTPLLAGSGGTFLVPAPDPATARRLAKRIAGRHPDTWVRVVRSA